MMILLHSTTKYCVKYYYSKITRFLWEPNIKCELPRDWFKGKSTFMWNRFMQNGIHMKCEMSNTYSCEMSERRLLSRVEFIWNVLMWNRINVKWEMLNGDSHEMLNVFIILWEFESEIGFSQEFRDLAVCCDSCWMGADNKQNMTHRRRRQERTTCCRNRNCHTHTHKTL
jgi:hypothetical protein